MYRINQIIGDMYTQSSQVDYLLWLALEKEMERWLVQSIYAPLKLREKRKVAKAHKKDVTVVADEAEQVLQGVSSQLDTSMKGEFSAKVHQAIVEKEKAFQKLGNDV